MMTPRKYMLSVLAVVLSLAAAAGQRYPERKYIRQGNRAYETQKFADAERGYRQAQIIDTASVAAAFNLADAQYATEQFTAAENTLNGVVKNPRITPDEAAKAYYNLGNAQFQQQKLQEALESYKSSLRLNPSDMEAKYNLAYTKKLLDQNQDQNQDNNSQNNQNKDQNQSNDNNDNNNNNQDKQDQNDKGQNDNSEQGDKPESREAPPQKKEVSPETEAMLQAVQQAEDKTREKVDAEKVVGVGRSGKNW